MTISKRENEYMLHVFDVYFQKIYGMKCLDATLIPDATFVVSVACEVTAFAFVGNGGVQDEPLYGCETTTALKKNIR